MPSVSLVFGPGNDLSVSPVRVGDQLLSLQCPVGND